MFPFDPLENIRKTKQTLSHVFRGIKRVEWLWHITDINSLKGTNGNRIEKLL